jgi:hypothetical protein
MFTAKQGKELSDEDRSDLEKLIEHIDSRLKSAPYAQIVLSLASANLSARKEGTMPWRVWAAAARAYKEAGWHTYFELDENSKGRSDYRLVVTLSDQDRLVS